MTDLDFLGSDLDFLGSADFFFIFFLQMLETLHFS